MKNIMLIAIAMLLIIGCSKTPTGGVVQEDVVKLGVIEPLTGPTARYGEAMSAGFELALDEINAEGGINGKRVELIYEDGRCMNQVALTSALKLLDVDNVNIILGSYCVGTNNVVSMLIEEKGKLQISPVSTAKDFSQRKNAFRTNVADIVELKGTVDYIGTKTNQKKLGILFMNNDFGFEYTEIISDYARGYGIEIVGKEGFELSDTDYRTQIKKVVNNGAEAIFVIGADYQTAMIAKQLKELGLGIQMYATVNTQNSKLLAIAGDSADGIIYNFMKTGGKEYDEFESKVRQRGYGGILGFAEVNSYDALKIAAIAMRNCDSKGFEPDDVECMKSELLDLKDYRGVGGVINFNKNGDVHKEMSLKTIKNGKFVELS